MTRDKDIIDSRDLIAELHAYDDALAEGEEPEIDQERAEAIRSLADEGVSDWEYGATMIHEDYFTEYAKDFAEDVGYIKPEVSWPYTHIDWESAATELQMDYTSVDFLGDTYYVR